MGVVSLGKNSEDSPNGSALCHRFFVSKQCLSEFNLGKAVCVPLDFIPYVVVNYISGLPPVVSYPLRYINRSST